MKGRIGSAVSGLLLLALCFVVSTFSQTNEKTIINKFIAKQAHEEEATEYKGARKVLRGDLNGDGKTDVVVLYTLEGFQGSNNYEQYIVVFLAKGSSFRYAADDDVGGKYTRAVSLRSVAGSKINLDTLVYEDGQCCEGKKVQAALVLKNGKLREL